MKELSIEEKAKAYDEVVNKLKGFMTQGVDPLITRADAQDFFPELKESEDERIRKAIIEHFEGSHSSMYPYKGFTKEQILAWLEKQGEQKTEVKYVYTKFQIGDTIVEIKPNGYCQPVRVKYIGDGAYSCESDDGKRSLSFPIINQDDYELVEQKHAWSEEDELIVAKILYICNDFERSFECSPSSTKVIKEDVDKIDNWLKSLKDRVQPQNTWKPSDEQIEAIRLARSFVTDDFDEHPALSEILIELEKQLKKLRQE